jgi:hypothetical protein
VRAVSQSFLNTVRGAHKAVFRARILSPGLTGTDPGPKNPDGTPLNEIPILSGDVTFDTSADVNATLDITVQLAWPKLPTSLGNPYGTEIYVERGVQYGDGTKEYVGLGYFRIDSVEQEKSPNGALRITGSDRMANVVDGRNVAPVAFGAGASVGSVLDLVVGEVVPGIVSVYDFSAYATLLGSTHIMSEDRLGFVQELVAAYGKVAYFDYLGRLVVKTPPDPTGAPVWDIDQGRNGVLVSMKRALSRDQVYNGVVASGEAAGELPPVRALVVDTDPLSPTLWGGPFGKVPRFFSSSFMTTVLQCTQAATTMLVSARGLPYVVSLGLVPNPALEGWDVVRVTYSNRDNPETHIIDKITYSLSVQGAMGIDTRKQFLT